MNLSLFRNFAILLAVFMLSGCVAYVEPAQHPVYGCAVIADEQGEREVCNVYYYESDAGVVYWDPYFSVWVGGGGYWRDGIWYRGYFPGYWARYRGFYRSPGFYRGYRYHGYYGVPHGVYRGGGHRR